MRLHLSLIVCCSADKEGLKYLFECSILLRFDFEVWQIGPGNNLQQFGGTKGKNNSQSSSGSRSQVKTQPSVNTGMYLFLLFNGQSVPSLQSLGLILLSNGKMPTGKLLLTSGRPFISPRKIYLQPIIALIKDLTLIVMQIVAK